MKRNKAKVKIELSQSQGLIDLIDLLREPFFEGEAAVLEGDGCVDMTCGLRMMYTPPTDEVGIVKLRLKNIAHYAVGDPETLYIYEAQSKLEEVITDVLDRYSLNEDF